MKRVCLITGAGGRLGQELCRRLSPHYHVIATYHNQVPSLPSQLTQPLKFGDPVLPPDQVIKDQDVYLVQADLTDRTDIRRLIEVGLARFGRIDCLVNSAADLRYHGKLLELWQANDYARSTLDLNAIAPMLLTSALFDSCWKARPDINARFNRSVVNVSSISGIRAYSSNSAFYAASKAALNMLTLFLSLELGPYAVRANALCPDSFRDAAATGIVADAVRQLLECEDNARIVSEL